MKVGEVDVLEFRIDPLADRLLEVEHVLRSVKVPVLLTVRHPAEGGIHNLAAARRKELYRRFLPFAVLVDVELRSLPAFADIVDEAKSAECGVVVSNHDFQKTPTLKQLIDRRNRAFGAGADVFKVACATPEARDLARLLDFASRPAKGLLAAMGMGRFGKVSRLALAEAGSVLNYGYLDKPNAPGQWEARELKRLISKRTS